MWFELSSIVKNVARVIIIYFQYSSDIFPWSILELILPLNIMKKSLPIGKLVVKGSQVDGIGLQLRTVVEDTMPSSKMEEIWMQAGLVPLIVLAIKNPVRVQSKKFLYESAKSYFLKTNT